MPIIPPVNAAPYDSVNTVLNAARVRVNSQINSLYPTGGRILENTQAFSQQAVNNGWRNMQRRLANLGYARFKANVIIEALPPNTNADPASQQYLSWSGFFDGTNFSDTPALPSDFLAPLRMKERQNGMNAVFMEPGMAYAFDGIPSNQQRQGANFIWEWRDYAIWIPGASYTMDFWIEYIKLLPDFEDTGETRWYNALVPIVDCLDPLANLIAAELATSRDDLDAGRFTEAAISGISEIMNRDTRLKQRYDTRRQSRSGRLEGRGNGWAMCY